MLTSHPHRQEAAATKTELYTENANGEEVQYSGSVEQMERQRRGEKLERIWDCTGCDKKFTREEHLNRHSKIHTDEPVHTCEVKNRKNGTLSLKAFWIYFCNLCSCTSLQLFGR